MLHHSTHHPTFAIPTLFVKHLWNTMKADENGKLLENIAQIRSYADQIRKGAIRLHEKGYVIAEDFYTIADYFDKYAKSVASQKGSSGKR